MHALKCKRDCTKQDKAENGNYHACVRIPVLSRPILLRRIFVLDNLIIFIQRHNEYKLFCLHLFYSIVFLLCRLSGAARSSSRPPLPAALLCRLSGAARSSSRLPLPAAFPALLLLFQSFFRYWHNYWRWRYSLC